MPQPTAVKDTARKSIERGLDGLVRLSHDHPRQPRDGVRGGPGCGLDGRAPSGAGYSVTTGTSGMPTAFTAETGSGPLVVALCAEYDALPGNRARAGTTSSPPPRSGPAWPWPGWPTTGHHRTGLGHAGGRGWRGQDHHAGRRGVRRRARRNDGSPLAGGLAPGHLPGRLPFRRDLPREERPRLGRPLGGGQRRRRHGAGAGGPGPPAPAVPPGGPGPRRGDRRRTGGERHPRAGRAGSCAVRP